MGSNLSRDPFHPQNCPTELVVREHIVQQTLVRKEEKQLFYTVVKTLKKTAQVQQCNIFLFGLFVFLNHSSQAQPSQKSLHLSLQLTCLMKHVKKDICYLKGYLGFFI